MCSLEGDYQASPLRLAKLGIAAGSAVVFLLLCRELFVTFTEEPTGSSLSSEAVKDLPFPAFTVCDEHFENRRAYQDLGFPIVKKTFLPYRGQ